MQAQPLCSNSNCRTHRRRRWPSKIVLCDRCLAGRNRADGIAANALRSALFSLSDLPALPARPVPKLGPFERPWL